MSVCGECKICTYGAAPPEERGRFAKGWKGATGRTAFPIVVTGRFYWPSNDNRRVAAFRTLPLCVIHAVITTDASVAINGALNRALPGLIDRSRDAVAGRATPFFRAASEFYFRDRISASRPLESRLI